MTKTNNQRFRGFTIVELTVYMALMGIFFIVLLDIFTLTLNTKLASQGNSAIAYDGRYILSKLTYDIQNATAITSPALGATSSSLQLTLSGQAVSYGIVSGKLLRTVGGSSPPMNGLDTNLANISFQNIGNSGGKATVRIIYTIDSEAEVSGNVKTQTITTTISTR